MHANLELEYKKVASFTEGKGGVYGGEEGVQEGVQEEWEVVL